MRWNPLGYLRPILDESRFTQVRWQLVERCEFEFELLRFFGVVLKVAVGDVVGIVEDELAFLGQLRFRSNESFGRRSDLPHLAVDVEIRALFGELFAFALGRDSIGESSTLLLLLLLLRQKRSRR